MNMKKHEQRGITLIALVITIIVLLILAGVSIATLTGENGLLKKVGESKEKTQVAVLKEEASLLLNKRKIDDITQEKKTLKEDLEKEIKGDKVIEEIEGIPEACYVTRDGNTITVYEDGTIADGKSIWDGTSRTKPTVDSNKNWHIYNTSELKYFSDFVNGKLTEEEKEGLTIEETTIVYLENHLDLGARQTEGTLTRGTKWEAIGKDKDNSFIGTFEGNNHIIRGIYMDRVENCTGLFGVANTIKNMTIKDSYILGGTATGGVAGVGYVIENCHNVNINVVQREGNYYTIGGIVGQVFTSITNCSNSGSITGNGVNSNGRSQCGGVAGYASAGARISNCTNAGVIVAKGEHVGGVVGAASSKSEMSKCTNTGAITGKGRIVGGIAGNANTESTISNCTNTGAVTGKGEKVGGIAGNANTGSTISNCTNTGVVTGKGGLVGGIVGNANASSIVSNCSNTGAVTGENNWVGGIVGALHGNMNKCYNTGTVKQTGGENLGGICGETGINCTANIKNCYNIGKVIEEGNGGTGVGGIVGWVSETGASGIISNNYNIGQIEIKGQNVKSVGGVIGSITTSAFTRNNNYFIEGTYKTADNIEGESKTEAEMKTQEFVDLLNTGLTENAWEIQSNKNNGYPTIIGME